MKISLKKGWNLASFKTTDLSILTLNENIIKIKSRQKSWDRNVLDVFNNLIQLEFTDGYYIFTSNATDIEYIPEVLSFLDYKFIRGWNLIGWQENIYFENLQLDNKILQIKGLDTSYDSSVPNIFNNLKELKEGNAYWVKVSDNYDWSVNLVQSNIEVKLDFNENLREYNVNIKSNGSSTNIEGYIKSSIGSINLDNYLVFQPGDKNRQMEINNDTISKFIVPDLEDKEKVEFKIRTVDLPDDEYILNISDKDYSLDIPKVKDYDYSESNYFQNNNRY